MKGRRWLSREATTLLKITGEADPAVAIAKLAAGLIDEAGFEGPPFHPHILASFQGVREVRRVPMVSAARLVPVDGALLIEVNEAHSPGKQNFSVDHEVTHTLLPTYTGKTIDDAVTGQFANGSEEELLCDIGASVLLLDRRWLLPMASGSGPSLESLINIGDVFGASLQATARALCELDVWPCAFVFWEKGYRKSERVSDEQMAIPGWESLGLPVPKFRVATVYTSASFSYFIPNNKSVDGGSLVVRCAETGGATCGVEDFDLGHHIPQLYCENLWAPYRSGEAVCGRVISLLLPTRPRTAPTVQALNYQFEAM